MTKRQLIDEIIAINRSAAPAFLAEFEDAQLSEYLGHLRLVGTPRLTGDSQRYAKYFKNCPTIPADEPAETHQQNSDASAPDLEESDRPEHTSAAEPTEADQEPVAVTAGASDTEEMQTSSAKADDDSESWLF